MCVCMGEGMGWRWPHKTWNCFCPEMMLQAHSGASCRKISFYSTPLHPLHNTLLPNLFLQPKSPHFVGEPPTHLKAWSAWKPQRLGSGPTFTKWIWVSFAVLFGAHIWVIGILLLSKDASACHGPCKATASACVHCSRKHRLLSIKQENTSGKWILLRMARFIFWTTFANTEEIYINQLKWKAILFQLHCSQ